MSQFYHGTKEVNICACGLGNERRGTAAERGAGSHLTERDAIDEPSGRQWRQASFWPVRDRDPDTRHGLYNPQEQTTKTNAPLLCSYSSPVTPQRCFTDRLVPRECARRLLLRKVVCLQEMDI